MNPLILIVDDEKDLIITLEYNFRKEGFRVKSALTGQQALFLLNDNAFPDIIILDLMLPDISGTEVCRKIRSNQKTQNIPIIFLTAKGEELDRLVGFEIGADDYLVKPFSIRELILRVKAVLRRKSEPNMLQENKDVHFGILHIDKQGHQVYVENTAVTLTSLEFKLLCTFAERKGRVQTRDMLLNDVWGIHADVTTRTVDTHVKRLRKKIGKAGEYIETLRGTGYRFRASL